MLESQKLIAKEKSGEGMKRNGIKESYLRFHILIEMHCFSIYFFQCVWFGYQTTREKWRGFMPCWVQIIFVIKPKGFVFWCGFIHYWVQIIFAIKPNRSVFWCDFLPCRDQIIFVIRLKWFRFLGWFYALAIKKIMGFIFWWGFKHFWEQIIFVSKT